VFEKVENLFASWIMEFRDCDENIEENKTHENVNDTSIFHTLDPFTDRKYILRVAERCGLEFNTS
jgi:hypothetical protein